MLLRFIVATLIVGAVLWALRAALRPKTRAVPQGLGCSELSKLDALAQRARHVAEGLKLREGIGPLLKGRADLRFAVDEAVRQLGAEAELLLKIEAALHEHDEGERRADLARAEKIVSEAADPQARRAAQDTVQALGRQRDAVAALDDRRGAVEASLTHLVVELREVRLALLDAAASPGGLGSGSAQVVEQLMRARDDVCHTTAAHDELERLSRGG